MTEKPARRLISSWFGTFLVETDGVLRAFPAGRDPAVLAARLATQREGGLAEDERAAREAAAPGPAATRDRRLAGPGISLDRGAEPSLDPREYGLDPSALRSLLLERAQHDLAREWDPTVHVQEAVSALTDLDELLNVLGERLLHWVEQDRPGSGHGSAGGLARELAQETPVVSSGPGGTDPHLGEARRRLAALYLEIEGGRKQIERVLEAAMPLQAPNLTVLLGPLLAARLIRQAGSLERLAQLPASTVQVLGAERAFFEHLRGRAPPPRHGLLFLHPRLHSAARVKRGKLARALAGKVAIAARLDRAGRPVEPDLARKFEARVREVEAASSPDRARRARRSRAPLDRASEDG